MKPIIKLFALAPLALALTACGDRIISGDGKISKDSRTLTGFNTIEVAGDYKVSVISGKMPMVEISADENLLSSISTDVQNKTLSIHGPRDVDLRPTQTITVKVTVTNLQNLNTSGRSSINADKFSGADLKIDTNGNSAIEVNKVSGDKLDLELSGDSQVKLVGQITNFNITSSGNSTVTAKNLISQNANLELSGSSTVVVSAQQTLQIKASGNTKVTYYGDPNKMTREVSGLTEITHIPLLKLSKPMPIIMKTAKINSASEKAASDKASS